MNSCQLAAAEMLDPTRWQRVDGTIARGIILASVLRKKSPAAVVQMSNTIVGQTFKNWTRIK